MTLKLQYYITMVMDCKQRGEKMDVKNMRKFINVLNESMIREDRITTTTMLIESVEKDIRLDEGFIDNLKTNVKKAGNFIKNTSEKPNDIINDLLNKWQTKGGDVDQAKDIIKKSQKRYPNTRVATLAASAILVTLMSMGQDAMAGGFNTSETFQEMDKQIEQEFQEMEKSLNQDVSQMYDQAENGEASYISKNGYEIYLDKNMFKNYFNDKQITTFRKMIQNISQSQNKKAINIADQAAQEYGFNNYRNLTNHLRTDNFIQQNIDDTELMNKVRFNRIVAFQTCLDIWNKLKTQNINPKELTSNERNARSGAGSNVANF